MCVFKPISQFFPWACVSNCVSTRVMDNNMSSARMESTQVSAVIMATSSERPPATLRIGLPVVTTATPAGMIMVQ